MVTPAAMATEEAVQDFSGSWIGEAVTEHFGSGGTDESTVDDAMETGPSPAPGTDLSTDDDSTVDYGPATPTYTVDEGSDGQVEVTTTDAATTDTSPPQQQDTTTEPPGRQDSDHQHDDDVPTVEEPSPEESAPTTAPNDSGQQPITIDLGLPEGVMGGGQQAGSGALAGIGTVPLLAGTAVVVGFGAYALGGE